MEITAKNVADFYNSTFFDEDQKAQGAEMDVIIRSGDKVLIMPGVFVNPNTPIHVLIKTFYNFLKKRGSIEVPAKITESESIQEKEPAPQPQTQVIDFKKMEYRGNFYFLELDDEEEIRIFNEARDKEISPKSAVGKSLIKRFKEEIT